MNAKDSFQYPLEGYARVRKGKVKKSDNTEDTKVHEGHEVKHTKDLKLRVSRGPNQAFAKVIDFPLCPLCLRFSFAFMLFKGRYAKIRPVIGE
jgi:hypothetical protein